MRAKAYDTSADASSGLFRRRVVSWLGLWLLAVNLIVGGILPARSAEAGPAPFAQDILSDRIVICTASGMLVVDRDGKPVDEGGQPSSHDGICVFCLPLMHSGASAPAADIGIALPSLSATVVALADSYRRPVLRAAHNPHPARAPPVLT